MRKRRKCKNMRVVLFLLLAFLTIIAFACEKYVMPTLEITAADAAAAKVNIAIAKAVNEIMDNGKDKFSGITNVVYDKNNSVKAIETDSIKLNALKSELESELGEKTHELTKGKVEISFGTLLGYEYTIGTGPKIPLEFDIENLTLGEYSDKFESAGINQTKYSVMLTVSTDIIVLIPWKPQTKTVKTDIVIAQTVIVGNAPNSYTNVNVTK